jgi:hypothetical protein
MGRYPSSASLLDQRLTSRTYRRVSVRAARRRGLTVGAAAAVFILLGNAVAFAAPPAAPSGVTAVAGVASASVSWTAPGGGGSPISFYTVTASTGQTATVTGSPPPTSSVVASLTPGVSVSFTVTATNNQGTSVPSSPSNPVVPYTTPGAPSGVSATAGDQRATVSWTAPSSDGYSMITSYTVTTSPGGGSVTVTGSPPTTSSAMTGLSNGSTYTFTVAATNAAGAGPVSTPSSPVTPYTVPSAPTDVTATPGNGQATVSWTAAGNNGSPIGGYTVVASPGGQTATVSGSPPGLTATVAGLTNGTLYTFTVAASNGAGTGLASDPSNPVRPSGSWSVSLNATGLVGGVESFELNASANGEVSYTGFAIEIFDDTTGQLLAACTIGDSCQASVSRSPFTLSWCHSYVAYVSAPGSSDPPPSVQATSAPISSCLGGGGLALSAAPPVTTSGSPVTLTAASSQPVDGSGFVIEIFDHTTGHLLVACATGATCSWVVTQATPTTHIYVAYIAPASSTDPPPNAQNSSQISVTWL